MKKLPTAIKQRARNWAHRRQGEDRAPVKLTRRRVYILPTHFGAIYAGIVFVMLLGSMNYNNSLGFALTFLLTSLGLVAMHHTHRNLTGIIISGLQTGEAFAGDLLRVQIGIENPSALRRVELRFDCADQQTVLTHIGPAARALLDLHIPTHRRGILQLDRIGVSTEFPFGLFRAWAWLNLPAQALIYPRPTGEQTPPIAQRQEASGALAAQHAGNEDFRGFRTYQPGDSPRRIAWKALARGAPLMVKEYSGAGSAAAMFDYDTLRGMTAEARLSQLCRWVLEADRQAASFGLRLPERHIPLAGGSAQRRRCLEALALFDLSASALPARAKTA
jgi:uncharacterized protein (DUF58 family)